MLFRRKQVIDDAGRVPVEGSEIEGARARCLQMVRKRAAISAGVAAVPLPVVDILSDLTAFTVLVDEINQEFGLTQKQIERLHPRLRVLAYEAAASVGGMLVGKLITRGLVMRLFRRSSARIAAKTMSKVVPLAGQIASAAIGYVLFKKMGDQHVEACVRVARELEKASMVDLDKAEPPMPAWTEKKADGEVRPA